MIDKCKELAAYARSIRSRIIATILLAVFCAGTVFAAATASYTVTVVDDGQARSVITTRSDANAILEQAKVEIGADDKVDLSAFISGEDSTITIYRAKNVTVSDGEAFFQIDRGGRYSGRCCCKIRNDPKTIRCAQFPQGYASQRGHVHQHPNCFPRSDNGRR